MKRLIACIITLAVIADGCVTKPQPPAFNVSSNVPISNTSNSQNTSLTSNISPNEISELSVPWPGIDVYSNENISINIVVGQEFIIRYDYERNMFPSFQVDYDTADVVILLDVQHAPKGQDPAAGTHWFLFEGAQAGRTTITIKEMGHPNTLVQSQKTFRISVTPSGSGNYTPPVTPAPILMSPANGLNNVPANTSFLWLSITGATYDFQLSTDSAFSNIVVQNTNLTSNTYTLSAPLLPDTAYYWRVRAKTPGALKSPWTTASFTTMPNIVITRSLAPRPAVTGIPDSVSLKAGEIKSINVTLEAQDRPANFSGALFLTDKQYGYYTMPMPGGFDAHFEPPTLSASPNTTYYVMLVIKTSPEVMVGEYWLRVGTNFASQAMGGWMRVSVT